MSQLYKKRYKLDSVKEIALNEEKFAPLYREDLERRNALIVAGNMCADEFNAARIFVAADEILIGAPYWDCLVPAALKCYLERASVAGITFGYVDNTPKGFCKAKKLVYITTSGGYIAADASLPRYLKELCTLYGIDALEVIKAEGLDIYGNDADKILYETAKRF